MQLLTAALAGTPRLPGAKCRTLFAAFDPADKGEPHEEVAYRHTVALSLCRTCPALASCAAWVEAHPPTRRPRGVIAGQVFE
ncbi:hypothetical protein BST33_10010 [Mycolicibacter minnesotensis]|uniref:4Fe-4S Wbl-type domain-containing protein n=1 Tax=Mycolicibacter minnesotensis TaxID=1118379 RepID=A0AA91RMD3_9MYCO|nr:hypothetical protein BST33_10010 [Mycolicibacter minnesotensis]